MIAEVEFKRWLDDCIENARKELYLTWPEILYCLLEKAKEIVSINIMRTA